MHHHALDAYCEAAAKADEARGLPPLPPAASRGEFQELLREKHAVPVFRAGFPVLKKKEGSTKEAADMTRYPPPNRSLTEHARRYQVGWALLEVPVIAPPEAPEVNLEALSPTAGPSPRSAAIQNLAGGTPSSAHAGRGGFSLWEQRNRPGLKLLLRVPAYVSHATRTLSRLPPNDAASLSASGAEAEEIPASKGSLAAAAGKIGGGFMGMVAAASKEAGLEVAADAAKESAEAGPTFAELASTPPGTPRTQARARAARKARQMEGLTSEEAAAAEAGSAWTRTKRTVHRRENPTAGASLANFFRLVVGREALPDKRVERMERELKEAQDLIKAKELDYQRLKAKVGEGDEEDGGGGGG